MIAGIEIEGLRGIREGRIEGLAPLTILVGPNGCGKSTVLEACGVACAGESPADVFAALASREWLGLAGLGYWFRDGLATVKSTFTEPVGAVPGRKRVTKIEVSKIEEGALPVRGIDEPGPWVQIVAKSEQGGGAGIINADGRFFFSSGAAKHLLPFALQTAFVDRPAGAAKRLTTAHFSSVHREALTAIKLSPWYDELFSYLQILRPALTSIESIAVGDRDEPHIFERDTKHGRVGYPLAYAGDGFRRSLLLAGTFARAKGGVAAVDEPEAFAHPGMFDALTGLLKRAVGDGTQVVLATHSLEFVAAALRAFEDQPEKAAVGVTPSVGDRASRSEAERVISRRSRASSRNTRSGSRTTRSGSRTSRPRSRTTRSGSRRDVFVRRASVPGRAKLLARAPATRFCANEIPPLAGPRNSRSRKKRPRSRTSRP